MAEKQAQEYRLGVPLIQLYSPYTYHTPAAIVLNKEGRTELIKALQRNEPEVVISAFVNNGEGFDLRILTMPEPEIRNLQDPYQHDWKDLELKDPKDFNDEVKGKSMNKNLNYGDTFFADIEIIKRTRFSHYLIEKEFFLEINSMKAIYFEMKAISDSLDELNWGILYPVYCFYKNIKNRLKRRRCAWLPINHNGRRLYRR